MSSFIITHTSFGFASRRKLRISSKCSFVTSGKSCLQDDDDDNEDRDENDDENDDNDNDVDDVDDDENEDTNESAIYPNLSNFIMQ